MVQLGQVGTLAASPAAAADALNALPLWRSAVRCSSRVKRVGMLGC